MKHDDVTRKFVDSVDITEDGWLIESDTGFEPLTHVNKTVEYDVYKITFDNDTIIRCADDHIFIGTNNEEVFAKDSLGISIIAKTGETTAIDVEKTEDKEHMFDVTVDSRTHTLYTDGILSHNSTVAAAFFCWYLIFNDNKTVAILANKAFVAKEILSRFQLAYENVPKFLKHGIVSWNKTTSELENGSRIIAASTSSSAIRGASIQLVYLDEYAHVHANIAEDFFTSVYPTLAAGKETKLIVTSTPHGYNHYYKMWNDAEQGVNGFNPIHVTWDAHPERDDAWMKDQLNILGEEKFSQEHMTEFLGSSNTLIASRDIKNMTAKKPLYTSESLRVFQEPKKDGDYVIICDPARGTGNDSSAFLVFDITSYPIKIVASYNDPHVSPLILPTILTKIGTTYNDASILVEINDNGQQVADILWRDLEYENTVIFGGFGGKKSSYGVRTTKSVKRLGCSLFKDMISAQKLIIDDLELISEISTFVKVAHSYKASAGAHDDLVMCCVLFAWFASTKEYQHLSNTDYKKDLLEQRMKYIEDDVMPFGFISDGISDSDKQANATFWGEGTNWF